MQGLFRQSRKRADGGTLRKARCPRRPSGQQQGGSVVSEEQKQQALVVAAQRAVALPVTSMQELAVAGEFIAQSGMFGKLNNAAGFVIAVTCYQQGISLIDFMRTYHPPVDGKLSMKADAMAAAFRNKGARYTIIENSVTRAAAEFEFEGQKVKFEYTMDDAKRIGDCFKGDGRTFKDNWVKRPEDMLWARMVSRAVRRLCPEVNAGMYSPEEVADFDDAPRSGPRGAAEIGTDEALRRAKAVTAEVGEVVTAEVGDASVCPDGFGEYTGKPWTEFDGVELEQALASDGLTANHRAAIRLVIEERKNVEKGGAA